MVKRVSPNKMVLRRIFIDFDDVLLNTKKFKRGYFRLFREYGISPGQAEATYDFMKGLLGKNDPRAYARYLAKNYHVPFAVLYHKVIRYCRHTSPYVFSDSRPFLRAVRKSRSQIILLSQGVKKFQLEKIKGSGLAHFFDEVRVVENAIKSSAVKKKEGGTAIFIDDREEVLRGIKKKFPRCLAIQVLRFSVSSRAPSADFVVNNLIKVLPLVHVYFRTK